MIDDCTDGLPASALNACGGYSVEASPCPRTSGTGIFGVTGPFILPPLPPIAPVSLPVLVLFPAGGVKPGTAVDEPGESTGAFGVTTS
ncbi:hypothetical protein D3C71_1931020 [compost metagenome]